MFLRYVGNAPFQNDNIMDSGTRWSHQGDIKEVPAGVGEVLLGYPDMWEQVEFIEAKDEWRAVTDSGRDHRPRSAIAARAENEKQTEQLERLIEKMDDREKKQFTAGGKPKVDWLQKFVSFRITSEMRDEAWDRVLEAREALYDMNRPAAAAHDAA